MYRPPPLRKAGGFWQFGKKTGCVAVWHKKGVALQTKKTCLLMTTIEDVIRIAVNAHDGMKDMVGNPAVAHVLAVGLMGKTVAEQKAGFLHDVVEDSDITIADLRAEGVEEDVLTAVDLLTHRPGITYEDYVRNIVLSGNQTAIQVKLNDLHHNLHRAELALATLDTSTIERKALLDEILVIAAMHDRAKRYIQGAITPRP